MNRHDRDWPNDILEAIGRVERYTERGRNAFDHNELVRVWVLYHIQVIGEAAAQLSDELRERYPHIPWSEIIGMRNFLVHAYFQL